LFKSKLTAADTKLQTYNKTLVSVL